MGPTGINVGIHYKKMDPPLWRWKNSCGNIAIISLRIMRMFLHEFFHMKFSHEKFCVDFMNVDIFCSIFEIADHRCIFQPLHISWPTSGNVRPRDSQHHRRLLHGQCVRARQVAGRRPKQKIVRVVNDRCWASLRAWADTLKFDIVNYS